jgi:SAM-dependent methyltransferase
MTMEWVEPFYSRQHVWLAEYYQAPLDELHRAVAAKIPHLASGPPGRVLELGAGGGQVAAATADLGYDVTAIDLVESAAAHARSLAASRPGWLAVITGDFYTVELEGAFEVVTYWDGFGLGTDDDQRRLLRRIAGWLNPGGRALIEVTTPWGASNLAGREQHLGEAVRRYDFDAEGCRMVDRWWPLGDETAAVSQSLRCYSPADLHLFLDGTGLRLVQVEPGGGIDAGSGEWVDQVPLGRALAYVAVLAPAST